MLHFAKAGVAEMPTLSILIVNYNGLRFLADCFASIKKHVSCSYEIIVVDNASSDGSCQFIADNYPEVRLVASPINTGFTGGNNLAGEHARGKYLLLLNNDTVLLSDIALAVAEFDDPAVGALGCHLVYGNGTLQHSFGFEHKPGRLVLFWLLGDIFRNFAPAKLAETDPAEYARTQANVAWVSGAFLLTRTELWQRLGGLDISYFMYVEDVDYCKRVACAGYRVEYFPGARIVHYGGAGRAWMGLRALQNTLRSYLIYTRKNYTVRDVLFLRIALSAVFVARAMAYGAIALVRRSSVHREKSGGFLQAAAELAGVRKPA
ncbi:MAG: Glycosyltransferase [Rhodocyclaceae bacterium]|nr:MAG: Glycosyltransferase [Rhodocyclaceae bacterium]